MTILKRRVKAEDSDSEYVCEFCGKYDKEEGFQVRLADSSKDSYLGWLCFGCYDRANEVDL